MCCVFVIDKPFNKYQNIVTSTSIFTCVKSWINCIQTHLLHQFLHPFIIHHYSLGLNTFLIASILYKHSSYSATYNTD